ncbi:hypothetical protein HFN49_23135 [Rhizobium leguminosarum]|uniref:hypothetical protein n=1 Tax=Rhizobium ruizarguesonis TaxID=2081791 RepID=UPI001A9946F6|nr:hypothetical protein [Rhizobium ruizarguesonis]MBY5889084.1 hypothetical protein [Rhizobium leguminosarum]QSZ03085.1 hypothetical protein J3P73_11740 [Rhizobium ruizarguesonis]
MATQRARPPSRIRADRDPDRPARITPDDPLRRTEKALRLVYGVVLPRMHSERIVGPGMARASWQRQFVLNHAVFQQLAAELGEAWMDLVRDADKTDANARRVERRHMEDAAEEIVAVVNALLPPLREVVVRRAAGMNWKAIAEALPHRAFFSMQDDHAAALRRVWDKAGDAVRRLI